MTFKTFIQTKAKAVFDKFVMTAVIHAEELLGSGAGEAKREAAFSFLLSRLPIYLQPFVPFFKKALESVADKLIEKAVDKLHQIQEKTGVLAV